MNPNSLINRGGVYKLKKNGKKVLKVPASTHRKLKIEASKRGLNLEFFASEMILAGLRNVAKLNGGAK